MDQKVIESINPSKDAAVEIHHDEDLAPASGSVQTSAAQWDRASDRVTFDWPAIERTAAEQGPNQGMAKLFLAARAEGATSRWPF